MYMQWIRKEVLSARTAGTGGYHGRRTRTAHGSPSCEGEGEKETALAGEVENELWSARPNLNRPPPKRRMNGTP